ncbi:MATE family efflux transporter [Acidaminococcus fermentans]|uniref:MATE family efflux transporter n=1 Tax=Acidaminococcus fermentans TaxID=905 RepID=UPI00242E77E1|nr:MATE family efflux transporter [Acidaminococcus fermentans]
METERQNTKRELDMLHGTLWDKIPLFALPVAATSILEQMYNVTDLAVLGHFAGKGSTAAIAAVGANSPVIALIVTFFVGIALGCTVRIANAIGRQDEETVHRTVHTAISLALLGGILVALLGETLAGPLLQLLEVPEEVLPQAELYLRIYLAGLPVIVLYNFEGAVFRSVGDTRTPLRALVLATILNGLLDLLFILGPGWMVGGVALGTVLANGFSALLLLWKLCRTPSVIRLQLRKLSMDGAALRGILQVGLPAGLQSAVFSLANLVIQAAVNSLGTVALAASSASLNIEIIVYDVLNAFSQACTTFVGQNFGAGQLRRCQKILKICLGEDILAVGFCIVATLGLGNRVLELFNRDPQVMALAHTRLTIVFSGYGFSLLYEVISGYLRGFGISALPAFLTFLGVCGTRLFWIWAIFPRYPSFQTVMRVYPLSLIITALLLGSLLLVLRPARRYEEKNWTMFDDKKKEVQ